MASSFWTKLKSLVKPRDEKVKSRKIRTYLDTGILIAAYKGTDKFHDRAIAIIDDPDREFIVSDMLWLEIVPSPYYAGNIDELAFIDEIFANATAIVRISQSVVDRAKAVGRAHGIVGGDSLHVASALEGKADVLVTSEKSTKPLLRVTSLNVQTIAGV